MLSSSRIGAVIPVSVLVETRPMRYAQAGRRLGRSVEFVPPADDFVPAPKIRIPSLSAATVGSAQSGSNRLGPNGIRAGSIGACAVRADRKRPAPGASEFDRIPVWSRSRRLESRWFRLVCANLALGAPPSTLQR